MADPYDALPELMGNAQSWAQDPRKSKTWVYSAEITECPCVNCECPELTDEDGPCLACRSGHHEGEEG